MKIYFFPAHFQLRDRHFGYVKTYKTISTFFLSHILQFGEFCRKSFVSPSEFLIHHFILIFISSSFLSRDHESFHCLTVCVFMIANLSVEISDNFIESVDQEIYYWIALAHLRWALWAMIQVPSL